jgi:hypothetical protein
LDLRGRPIFLQNTEQQVRGGVLRDVILHQPPGSAVSASAVHLVDRDVDPAALPKLLTELRMSGEDRQGVVDDGLLVEDPPRELHRLGEQGDGVEVADHDMEEVWEEVPRGAGDRLRGEGVKKQGGEGRIPQR